MVKGILPGSGFLTQMINPCMNINIMSNTVTMEVMNGVKGLWIKTRMSDKR